MTAVNINTGINKKMTELSTLILEFKKNDRAVNINTGINKKWQSRQPVEVSHSISLL